MMAMRWLHVLAANLGFTVSAKWVILTAHIGSANCGKEIKTFYIVTEKTKAGKNNKAEYCKICVASFPLTLK